MAPVPGPPLRNQRFALDSPAAKTEKAAANSEARGTGYSSGIDWTQDSSCANGDMIVQGEDGYGHMILDEQGRPVEP